MSGQNQKATWGKLFELMEQKLDSKAFDEAVQISDRLVGDVRVKLDSILRLMRPSSFSNGWHSARIRRMSCGGICSKALVEVMKSTEPPLSPVLRASQGARYLMMD